MTTADKIQEVKRFICNYAFSYSWNTASRKEFADEAETIISLVSINDFGFATEISKSVEKYRKISEKQAYWIAKAAVENNKVSRIDFLFEMESEA